MPISELGYRHWEGKRVGALRRLLAITRSEVSIAYQGSKLLRRFLFLAWVPILYYCPAFLAIGFVADPSNDLGGDSILGVIASEMLPREAIMAIRAHPEQFLPIIWSAAFYFFFAWSQSFLSMIVVAIAGPPLISRDLKSKAFLVYFSKPIQGWQYLLGKLLTLVYFVFSMTLIPALLLYTISIALSPDGSTLQATLPIVLKIALASTLTAVPIGLVVLLISSLTSDRRIATFAWMLLWIFGEIAFRVLTLSAGHSSNYEPPAWATLLSLRELTMRAASGIFGVRAGVETLFAGLGESGSRVSRELISVARDLGDASVMDRPRDQLQITDLAGLGLSPSLAIAALIGLSLVCGLLVIRRATQAVRI